MPTSARSRMQSTYFNCSACGLLARLRLLRQTKRKSSIRASLATSCRSAFTARRKRCGSNHRNFRSRLCISIEVRYSRVSALTTIVAIGCLLFVVGVPVSYALARYCGTVVVQGSLISAPEHAVATSIMVVSLPSVSPRTFIFTTLSAAAVVWRSQPLYAPLRSLRHHA